MKNNPNRITSSNILPTFFMFSIPNILSFMAMSSSAFINAIFVGQFAGPVELAAANIVAPFFSLCFGLSIVFISGGAVRTGKYIGQKLPDEARKMFTKTICAVMVMSTLITITACVFPQAYSKFFGANEELMGISSGYLRILAAFMIFSQVGYAMSVFIRIDGRPFFASATVISGSFINIAFNILFVWYLRWGLEGAALGSGLSSILIFIVLSTHYISKKGQIWIVFKVDKWLELAKSAYNGISEFIGEMSNGIVVLFFNHIMIKSLGTSGVTAYTAINYMMFFGGVLHYSTADSLTPLVSINYGAGNFDRAKKFAKVAGVFVVFNGFILFLVLSLFPSEIVKLFIPDTSSRAFTIAVDFIFYMRWLFLFNGVNMVFSAYFTALNRPLESAIISVLKGLILPVTFLSLLPKLLGNMGIYISVPASDIITLIIALYILKLYNKAFARGRIPPPSEAM